MYEVDDILQKLRTFLDISVIIVNIDLWQYWYIACILFVFYVISNDVKELAKLLRRCISKYSTVMIN